MCTRIEIASAAISTRKKTNAIGPQQQKAPSFLPPPLAPPKSSRQCLPSSSRSLKSARYSNPAIAHASPQQPPFFAAGLLTRPSPPETVRVYWVVVVEEDCMAEL